MSTRGPCMTLKELARETGVTQQALSRRSKKHPLPAEVLFEDNGKKQVHLSKRRVTHSRQFRRSELLAWFEVSSK